MKVEECIPTSRRDTIPPQTYKKPPCDGEQMMDKCPEPMLRAHTSHYPPNLVLAAGLSVLAVSIYALKVVGYFDEIYRPNVDYAKSSNEE
ncbi:hypothetical protein L9F63_000174 [Diploptera punctata]|uniref:Uncharacterized protein n=1 Tax=Diploptera punctata TaxID=6984 RepID=A0AAD8AM99_DIPPU|nr:hypothetical protein L9F63_000174 [Diploptera punctata]